MMGAVYFHYTLKDSFDRMAPCFVFSLLIICRLIILFQVNHREKREIEMMKKYMNEINKENENEELIDDDDNDVKKEK